MQKTVRELWGSVIGLALAGSDIGLYLLLEGSSIGLSLVLAWGWYLLRTGTSFHWLLLNQCHRFPCSRPARFWGQFGTRIWALYLGFERTGVGQNLRGLVLVSVVGVCCTDQWGQAELLWNQHFYSNACGPDSHRVRSNRHDGGLCWCDNSTGIVEAEWSASAWLSWDLIMHAEAWIHLIQIRRGTVWWRQIIMHLSKCPAWISPLFSLSTAGQMPVREWGRVDSGKKKSVTSCLPLSHPCCYVSHAM